MYGDDACAGIAPGGTTVAPLRPVTLLVRKPKKAIRQDAAFAPPRPRQPDSRNVEKAVFSSVAAPIPLVPRPTIARPTIARPTIARPRAAPGAMAWPEADLTDVFWRPPGRHRALELPAVQPGGWHRWPWSIGIDAVAAMLGLSALLMLVDVLL
ncbi:hypothetical protein ACQP00_09855 [Dactylosporangium sp. CS-047395]|uniref:hypothetical protein n=1 Tax=Dactylosporangium sp. CS-047395 TaxID=3239936 RepID=UPI003D8B34A0